MGMTIGLIGGCNVSQSEIRQVQKDAEEFKLSHLTMHHEGTQIGFIYANEGSDSFKVFLLPIHVKGKDQDLWLAGKAFELGYSKTNCKMMLVQR